MGGPGSLSTLGAAQANKEEPRGASTNSEKTRPADIQEPRPKQRGVWLWRVPCARLVRLRLSVSWYGLVQSRLLCSALVSPGLYVCLSVCLPGCMSAVCLCVCVWYALVWSGLLCFALVCRVWSRLVSSVCPGCLSVLCTFQNVQPKRHSRLQSPCILHNQASGDFRQIGTQQRRQVEAQVSVPSELKLLGHCAPSCRPARVVAFRGPKCRDASSETQNTAMRNTFTCISTESGEMPPWASFAALAGVEGSCPKCLQRTVPPSVGCAVHHEALAESSSN
jgi:hypothetical protein